MGIVVRELARMIDHTLLKPEATKDDIVQLCIEARQYEFASVCVSPTYVQLCVGLLRGTPVKVGTVVGFPLGVTLTQVKVLETTLAVAQGATELDIVINIGALKDGDYSYVEGEIGEVVRAAGPGVVVKVILETGLLTDEEKVIACRLAQQAGAHFVKTSTGFGPGKATVEDVALMRRVIGQGMGVKAAGGIRDYATALALISAGASRIGTSTGVQIVQEGGFNRVD